MTYKLTKLLKKKPLTKPFLQLANHPYLHGVLDQRILQERGDKNVLPPNPKAKVTGTPIWHAGWCSPNFFRETSLS